MGSKSLGIRVIIFERTKMLGNYNKIVVGKSQIYTLQLYINMFAHHIVLT